MQQKQDDGTWKTVLTDLFTRDYQIFGLLSDVRYPTELGPIAHDGLPDDFLTTTVLNRDRVTTLENCCSYTGYWMGEHSFGWIGCQEIVDLMEPTNTGRFTLDYHSGGFIVKFDGPLKNDSDDFDDDYVEVGDQELLNQLGNGLQILLSHNLENYRLVFGYDS